MGDEDDDEEEGVSMSEGLKQGFLDNFEVSFTRAQLPTHAPN